MKALLIPITRIWLLRSASLFLALSTLASAVEPHESGAGKICGVLRNFDGHMEVFDYTRTQIGEAAFGSKLHCGDWISVDHGKATIEHAAGAAVLVGENTFFQILDPQSGENPDAAHFALYRGEFMAQATSGEIRVSTPNAVGRFEKGGAYFVYASEADETQVVGLGAKTSLENRFFTSTKMAAEFGKVVTFSNPVERLIPDQGRFVNAKDLNERLGRLGVPLAVREALDKAVKVGVKTKMPVTLAVLARSTDKKIEKVSAGGELASAQKPVTVQNRKPASTSIRKRVVMDEPNFTLKRQSIEVSEKKRLLQALSTLHGEDEIQ